jgi:hypothetical protein
VLAVQFSVSVQVLPPPVDLGGESGRCHRPVVELDLAELPEDLQRQLFDASQLQIWYQQPSRRVASESPSTGTPADASPPSSANTTMIIIGRDLGQRQPQHHPKKQ